MEACVQPLRSLTLYTRRLRHSRLFALLVRLRPYALPLLFYASLLGRIVLTFIYNPLDTRFSDPMRHWQNGERFFAPDFIGAGDPLVYQVYIYALQHLTGDARWAIALVTGLLSAALPFFWYKALGELLPKQGALAGGLAIALMPSLAMIYGYFMNETLLLTLMAAAVWLSLRAARTGHLHDFTLAALLWALACYTRLVALPAAACFLCFLLLHTHARLRDVALRATIAAAFFAALAVPACWHSSMKLHFCAPFGMPYINQLYRLSQQRIFTMNVHGEGSWVFGSPNYYHPPLEPLSSWTTLRTGTVHAEIDPARGRADWETALQRIASEPKRFSPLQDWAENALYFFFDSSWPDNNPHYWLGWAAVQSRWLILPMALLITGFTAYYYRHMAKEVLLLPALTLLMFFLLITQQRFIIEGRYRKAVEPMLIASCVILLNARRRA